VTDLRSPGRSWAGLSFRAGTTKIHDGKSIHTKYPRGVEEALEHSLVAGCARNHHVCCPHAGHHWPITSDHLQLATIITVPNCDVFYWFVSCIHASWLILCFARMGIAYNRGKSRRHGIMFGLGGHGPQPEPLLVKALARLGGAMRSSAHARHCFSLKLGRRFCSKRHE